MTTVSTINTSIKQVPAIFNQLTKTNKLNDKLVINFGCGRYPDIIDNLINEKVHNGFVISYDPLFDNADNNESFVFTEYYHLLKEVQTEHDTLETSKQDEIILVCPNVLNVLTDSILDIVIKQLKELLIYCNTMYIQIYEGDRTGIGRATKKGYQRNERTINYIAKLESHNIQVKRKGNMLELSNNS